jgi:proteasome lid subunit RPN8/RPN11
MLNAARSPTFYEFEPGEMQKLYLQMDRQDEWPVVIYHSHTATEAYPSRTDIGYASGPVSDPRIHYVLVSTRDDAVPNDTGHDLHSYRIVDGEVTEEDIQVVESYMFAHTGADDVPDHS